MLLISSRWIVALPVVGLAFLVLAPSAHAAIYQAATSAEFTTALANAEASGEPDTIKLGAATFDGPFVYSGSSALEIVGSGSAQTIVTTSANAGIELLGSGAGHRIAGLGVRVEGGTTVFGLRADTPSTVIEDVTVSQTGGSNLFAISTRGAGDAGPDLARRGAPRGGRP